ncbi:MAG: MazG nucleotide pyrophosphohydrolase domain-containing protein [Cellvibrionaceae bacterium]
MDTEAIVREFGRVAKTKRWDRLHTPRNLSQALTVEANELMEAVSAEKHNTKQIAAEIADVQMYLLALAASLNIDVAEAVNEKQSYNQRRFNAE